MELEELKQVQDIMNFATESHNCMIDIITIVKEKDYKPEVFKSAIESINRLLDEKERK